MRPNSEVVLFLVSFLLLEEIGGEGYCDFPQFLWQGKSGGTYRKWITKTEYIRNTDKWAKQMEITVYRTEMVIRNNLHVLCSSHHSSGQVPCSKKDMMYKITCITDERGDKFRILREGHGENEFTCMKFIEINVNMIRVYAAEAQPLNEDWLCYDQSLQRGEWPWIAPSQLDWSLCPMVGGFDFHTFMGEGDHKQELCPRVWRPSRLECECVYGEGVDIFFPEDNCSPFYHKDLEQHLQCWGHWKEGNFTFVLMGHPGKTPQYMLRYPREDHLLEGEFVGHFYFAPYATTSENGVPRGRISYVELHMRRSDPGICFDESEKCPGFAQEGKCTNSALHKVANYCKKSCGLCEFIRSVKSECRFPEEFRGEWILFETARRGVIEIGEDEILFSHLGKFVCKTLEWNTNHYKLISTYANGCRPRYTCMHLSQDEDNILKMQISRSKTTDESFAMCKFKNDPPPLGNRIRSADMKVLLAKSHISWGDCELGGQIRINTTMADGKSCQGTLSDWNPASCSVRAKLTMSYNRCSLPKEDYLCIAHLKIRPGVSILVTQSPASEQEYSCWTIIKDTHSRYQHVWKAAYQMSEAQCRTDLSNAFEQNSQPLQTLRVLSNHVETLCINRNDASIYKHNDNVEEQFDPVYSVTSPRTPVRNPKGSKSVRSDTQEMMSPQGGTSCGTSFHFLHDSIIVCLYFVTIILLHIQREVR